MQLPTAVQQQLLYYEFHFRPSIEFQVAKIEIRYRSATLEPLNGCVWGRLCVSVTRRQSKPEAPFWLVLLITSQIWKIHASRWPTVRVCIYRPTWRNLCLNKLQFGTTLNKLILDLLIYLIFLIIDTCSHSIDNWSIGCVRYKQAICKEPAEGSRHLLHFCIMFRIKSGHTWVIKVVAPFFLFILSRKNKICPDRIWFRLDSFVLSEQNKKSEANTLTLNSGAPWIRLPSANHWSR